METAIALKGLTKRYPGFTLGPLDLKLPAGAILGLIGENGAGKTTTIKAMLDLTAPDGGEVRLLERSAQEAKEDIGVVLDECFFPGDMQVKHVDAVLRHVFRRWDAALFTRLLARYGLEGEKTIKDLSRGMRMKLSLAAALAHRPKLLILDEATSGLDPVVREGILDDFRDFASREDHAILLSSHITSDLEQVADYIAYLHRGKLLLFGEKDALLESHGRLLCRREELEALDRGFLVGVRRGQYSTEALIRRRQEFHRRYPQLTVEPATLEDIMVFTEKGEAVCGD